MAIGASWCKDGQISDQRKRAHPDDQNAVVAVAVVVEGVDKCVTAVTLAVMHLSISLVWFTARRSRLARRAHYPGLTSRVGWRRVCAR